MDSVHGGQPAAAAAGGDWRAQLQPLARGRIVRKISETLKKQLPLSVPEGLAQLQRIAVRFEEKIYNSATSQSDYLRKISLKMLATESQSKTNIQENHQNGQVIQNQSPVYLVSEEAEETGDLQGGGGKQAAGSASTGSTSHTGYSGAGDLKEELYQMSKTLKDQYLAGLRDLHEISMKLQGDNHVPPQMPANLREEASFKGTLKRSLHSLQLTRIVFSFLLRRILPCTRSKLPIS